MNSIRIMPTALALWLAAFTPAYAASTTTVYNSGILVLAFVGFCALVLVVQLIPAIITLWGIIAGLLTGSSKEKTVAAKAQK